MAERAGVAAELRVSVRTVEREIRDGKLAVNKVRSLRMVARTELDRYIAAGVQIAGDYALYKTTVGTSRDVAG